ncbi:hypothetical protein F4803DRAFT_300804 [Xylaria telfairii]|nr:hypothetical protein F4803DRAFT_300804 [Xylaria telfairii]
MRERERFTYVFNDRSSLESFIAILKRLQNSMAESCKEARESHQIAILVSQNIGSIKALLSSLTLDEDHYPALASQFARFKLWAGSLGAHRKSGRRSLDYRLRDASSIRKHVIMLLDRLSEAIKFALSSPRDSKAAWSEASDLLDPELIEYLVGNDESNQSSLDMALADISHVVDCMLRLSVTIGNPTPHDQFMSRAGLETIPHFEQYDVRHVQEKFNRVEEALATRLGRAITVSRHFLKYRGDHHARISAGIGDDNGLPENSDQTTIASAPGHYKDPLDEISICGSDDRSVISETSYAPSLYSIDELRVPPIPKEYLAGPFLCPFCYRMIEIDSRIDWKRHVFSDLQPYICLAPFCLAQHHKFSRRADWSRHMEQVHWRLWKCFCGQQETFDDVGEFQCHLRKAHPDDLTPEQQTSLAQICSEIDVSKAVGPCPLCVEVHISSTTQYYTHVSHHLEELALFALPMINNENDETVSQEGRAKGEDIDQGLHSPNSTTTSSNSSNDQIWTEEKAVEEPEKPFEQLEEAADQLWKLSLDREHNASENTQKLQEGPEDDTSEMKYSTVRLHSAGETGRGVYGGGRGAGSQPDKAKWRWNCCGCGFQNLSYNWDVSCPGCAHRRDGDCRLWAIA